MIRAYVPIQVEVPGGQAIYVAPSGQVSYTAAHSSSSPPGSTVGGWFNKTVVSDCEPPRDVLDYSFGGVKVCPDVAAFMAGTGASYQLYVGTQGFNLTDCIDAVGLSLKPAPADVGCWQYI